LLFIIQAPASVRRAAFNVFRARPLVDILARNPKQDRLDIHHRNHHVLQDTTHHSFFTLTFGLGVTDLRDTALGSSSCSFLLSAVAARFGDGGGSGALLAWECGVAGCADGVG
jgi:hypothetical protein